MSIDRFANQMGPWLRGGGPQSDIVISSRIRLARNVAEFPFIMRCNDLDRANIESSVSRRLKELPLFEACEYFNVFRLSPVDRQYLVERQLISRELSENSGARGVFVDRDENFSVMINEEDHLRIQVMRSGLDFEEAWKQINTLDDQIDEKICYAYDSTYGYLTACPTNVGTGMRVSVMLHLPALVLTKQIEKVFRSLQKINLAVRGLYGEGSQAMGDFYQISNQITLGKSEDELIKQVGDVVPVIISYERKARQFLVEDNRDDLSSQVHKALNTLQQANQISSEETMHLLSKVRLGINLDLIDDIPIPTINKLFIHTQPAHLQKLRGSEMDTSQRNKARALYLHTQLEKGSEDPSAS
jgi:protein arginine kinase